MINIVTIESKRYVVDVGFGSNSPTIPVPLESDFTSLNILPGHSMLLQRGHIPDNTHKSNPEQMLWIYNIRFTANSPYMPAYCFSDVEFLPRDFETVNFFVSKSPKSWFTYYVVCLKYLLDEATEEIVGDITLFGNDLKERRHGKSRVLMEIASEEDRIEALEKYLGITLSQPEKDGIRGMVTQIT